MMKIRLHILCLVALLMSGTLGAQSLPTLGTAPEITVGKLPNGVSYYVAGNTVKKGYADYALVQKGVPDPSVSRKALSSLPHLGTRVPYEFVSSYGSICGRRGYVSYLPSSTRFDFPDMPVTDKAVSDTTLMMLFDIASTSSGDQAIVICGDVTPSSIVERLKMYSILLEPRTGAPEGDTYEWRQRDSLTLRTLGTDSGNVAVINLIFSTGRTERANLNTPLPLVTQTYAREFGVVLEERLRRNFAEAGIPLLHFRWHYQDSSQGPEDERYRISVVTALDSADKASTLVAGTLSDLDSNGAGIDEFRYSKVRALSMMKEEASRVKSNRQYVEKCVASYLYGTDLASEKALVSTITDRSIAEERELALFNGFVAALLDSARNLVLRFDLPRGMEASHLADAFDAGWGHPVESRFDIGDGRLPVISEKTRIKLKSDAAEPITGGRIWTFSNGMSVICKQMPSDGMLNYSVLLRGGYPDVPGLRKGEGVYVGDMLKLCRVAGRSWNDFRMMLEMEGMSMETEVTHSDLRICGRVPSDRMDLLFASLQALAGDRTPDPDAFEAFRTEESFRSGVEALSPRQVNALMDGMISPGYIYSEKRDAANIGPDLQTKAEAYFSRQFSKFSDGVVVLIGDFDSERLKKDLVRMLGGFETRNVHASRPVVEMPLYSGRTSVVTNSANGFVGGAEQGVNMAFSSLYDFSMVNDMSFRVAVEWLRIRLAPVLARNGYSAVLKGVVDFFPKERVTLYVNAVPCFADGLPYGVEPVSPSGMQEIMREFFSGIASERIPSSVLKMCRSVIQNEMDSIKNSSEDMMDKVLVRYSCGKNTYSNYGSALDAVSAESVRTALAALTGGVCVEYVIEK